MAEFSQAQKPTARSFSDSLLPPGTEIKNAEEEEQIKVTIQSLNILIKNVKSKSEKRKLIFNQAKLMVSLAKKLQISGKKNSDPELKGYLDEASKRIQFILSDTSASVQDVANAHYLAGTLEDLREHDDRATVHFKKFLALNPQSPEIGWMTFYIAEKLFDAAKFSEALTAYRKYYEKFPSNLKRMAMYKMAWCYVNVNRPEMAEKTFLVLIGKGADKGVDQGSTDDLSKDSLRDLSYLVVKTKSDADIVALAEKEFPAEDRQFTFLSGVLDQQEIQKAIGERSLIIEKILTLEKNPETRFKLNLKLLRRNVKPYASISHFRSYQNMKQLIQEPKMTEMVKGDAALRALLDEELKKLIQAYLDTWNHVVKTPEAIPPAQIAKNLIDIIELRMGFDIDPEFKKGLFSVWINLCQSSKNYECSNSVAQKILEDSSLDSLHESAQLSRIVYFEEAAKKSEKKFIPELMEALDTFSEKFPKSKSWTDVTVRSGDLRLKQGQMNEALLIFEKAYAVKPTENLLYKIQWARFSMKDYEKVMKENRLSSFKVKNKARFTELQRESALSLALQNKEKGDLETYEFWIRQFLARQPNAEKEVIAKRDLIRLKLDRNEDDEALSIFKTISAKDRLSKKYSDLLVTLSHRLLKQGKFQAVAPFFPSSEVLSEDLLYLAWITRLGLNQAATLKELHQFTVARREYLFSLLSLFRPSFVLQYFEKEEPQSKYEKNVLLVAKRFEKNEWSFDKNKLLEKLLTIRIPKVSQAKLFQKHILTVRETRKWVKSDLVKTEADIQYKILNVAQSLEKQTAAAILSSPLPKKITVDQKKEYKKGLSEVASEFTDQSNTYGKLIETVSQKMKGLSCPKSKNDWDWGKEAEMIQPFVQSGKWIGAMLVLDLNRETLFKNDETYYRIRSGILLFGNSSPIMPRYVEEELKSKKQEKTLEYWRSL